jgi:hypothetical protein
LSGAYRAAVTDTRDKLFVGAAAIGHETKPMDTTIAGNAAIRAVLIADRTHSP